LWNSTERAFVESKLGAAIVGGPETVERELAKFVEETEADEIMMACELYDQSDRLRSYELVASLVPEIAQVR
jgi:alkanesulfonate monooxygenase SsuD/methylene tetrahydromethanopterin reductase-like flavin-dependent oxidoreductase (luciferase family)